MMNPPQHSRPETLWKHFLDWGEVCDLVPALRLHLDRINLERARPLSWWEFIYGYQYETPVVEVLQRWWDHLPIAERSALLAKRIYDLESEALLLQELAGLPSQVSNRNPDW